MQERNEFVSEPTSTLSLREYGDILRRRRAIILQTAVIVFVVGVLVTLFQTPVYQASARLLLEPQRYMLNVLSSDPISELLSGSQGYGGPTQVVILQSSRIRELAAKKMPNGKSLTGYSVKALENTSIIELTAEGADPNAVAETANRVLEVYADDTFDISKDKLEAAKRNATDRLNKLLEQEKDLRKKLLKIQNDAHVADAQAEIENQNKLLAGLIQDYEAQRSNLALIQTKMAEIRKKIASKQMERTENQLPFIEADTRIQQLDDQIQTKELDLKNSLLELGDGDDRIVILKQTLDGLRKMRLAALKNWEKRNARFNPDLRGFQSDLLRFSVEAGAIEQAAISIRKRIDEVNKRLAQFPMLNNETARLKQDLEYTAGQIKQYITAQQQILLKLETQAPSSRVIEKADVPGSPVRPKKLQNIMFSALLGVLFGLALAVALEMLDDRINSPEEAERVLRLPNLGQVQMIEEEGLRLIRDISTFSPLMESYRSLRTNINFAAVGSTMNSIVVTSSVPAEGKSTTAANLAMALALDGKRVIIVDADLRRPNLHKLFRIESSPGLTDALVGTHEVADVIRSSGVENVSVIPAGSPPPNPAELLGSSRMVELVARLESMADVVLFDSPPTLLFADSVVLSSRTNGVLLVVGFGETKKTQTRKAIEMLRRANANVLGTVLNRIEAAGSGYGYGYGYYYGRYYAPATLDNAGGRGTTASAPALESADENDTAGKGSA